MDGIEMLLTRKTIRNFTNTPLSNNQLDLILNCGNSAPSADNIKAWEFIVIDDKEMMEKIANISQGINFLKDAPVGIAVCGNISNDAYKGFWISDCSAVAENMLLAAYALGLGGVWAALHPLENRMREFSKLLNLPKNILPLCVVAIGNTTENLKSEHRELDLKKIHKNGW